MASLIFALLLALAGPLAWALDVLPVPALTARVIDQTGTLTPAQTAELDQKLAEFERSKGSQVVVLMVPTTQPEEISGYANRVGNAWKIGRKSEGDGVLLIVAKNDRRVRIEVAKSLEGAIPDLAAKQIIDSAITPNFKAGNFAAGLGAASDLIMARVAAEGLPPGESAQGTFGGGEPGLNPLEDLDWLGGAIFLLFAVPVGVSVASAFFGRKLGAVVAGAGVGGLAFFVTASIVLTVVAGIAALVWALLVGTSTARSAQSGMRGRRGLGTSSAGWGSGWGSGSSGGFGSGGGGGGFSSGGGGDFGGGGSSGDW